MDSRILCLAIVLDKNRPSRRIASMQKSLRAGSVVGLSNPKGIAFFVGLYAAVIPADTSVWAKAIILLGGFLIEAAWYGLVGTLLSMVAPRAFYARFAK